MDTTLERTALATCATPVGLSLVLRIGGPLSELVTVLVPLPSRACITPAPAAPPPSARTTAPATSAAVRGERGGGADGGWPYGGGCGGSCGGGPKLGPGGYSRCSPYGGCCGPGPGAGGREPVPATGGPCGGPTYVAGPGGGAMPCGGAEYGGRSAYGGCSGGEPASWGPPPGPATWPPGVDPKAHGDGLGSGPPSPGTVDSSCCPSGALAGSVGNDRVAGSSDSGGFGVCSVMPQTLPPAPEESLRAG